MLLPEPIVRDAEGFWVHSCVLNGPDETAWHDLPGADGMQFYYVGFFDDAPELLQAMYEGDSDERIEGSWQQAVTSWEPSPPEGDGWFLAGIYDTEEGPYACFTRPMPAAHQCPDCNTQCCCERGQVNVKDCTHTACFEWLDSHAKPKPGN